MGWGFWVYLLGWQVPRAQVILVLRECIWNASAVRLFLTAYDDTGTLGSPSHQVVYPYGSTLGDSPHFLVGNRETELKPNTFSSLLIFCDFLPFLFS